MEGVFLKTVSESEKTMVTYFFFFSYNVFHTLKDTSQAWDAFDSLFVHAYNAHLQFVLTLYQTTKFLASSKLEAFADDKIYVVKMMISLLDRVGNTVGKGENASYQHFLLFPQYFPSSLRSLKVEIAW